MANQRVEVVADQVNWEGGRLFKGWKGRIPTHEANRLRAMRAVQFIDDVPPPPPEVDFVDFDVEPSAPVKQSQKVRSKVVDRMARGAVTR